MKLQRKCLKESTVCESQCTAALTLRENSKKIGGSIKRHNCVDNFGCLPAHFVWVSLLIINN